MKICIRIDKNTALLAGKDNYGVAIVSVSASELSPEQRETLSLYSPTIHNKDFDYDISNRHEPINKDIIEANIESVKIMLDRLSVINKENKEKEEAEIQKQKENKDKEISEFLLSVEADPETAYDTKYSRVVPHSIFRPYYLDPRLLKLYEIVKAECHLRNDKFQANRDAEKAAKELAEEIEKEADRNELLRWSETFGSPLLKARISEEYEWLNLAEVEYSENIVSKLGTQLEIPSFESSKENPRTTPKLVEIEAVKLARKLLEGTPSQVDLVWSEYILKDDSKLKRSEIKVTVTCPTGRKLEYYFKSEDA